MNDLVSIIMPSYNTSNYIEASIESVRHQTYENWELIIVDDCSTDDTDEVVRPFLSDRRIRYLKNEQNSGAAISRNWALREAKGKWIAFLDSDDLWLPEKLEKQVAFMEQNGYHFSYTNYEEIDMAGEKTGVRSDRTGRYDRIDPDPGHCIRLDGCAFHLYLPAGRRAGRHHAVLGMRKRLCGNTGKQREKQPFYLLVLSDL